jgi:hypothetical protein
MFAAKKRFPPRLRVSVIEVDDLAGFGVNSHRQCIQFRMEIGAKNQHVIPIVQPVAFPTQRAEMMDFGILSACPRDVNGVTADLAAFDPASSHFVEQSSATTAAVARETMNKIEASYSITFSW